MPGSGRMSSPSPSTTSTTGASVGGEAAGAGLVYSSTSQTQRCVFIREQARVERASRSIKTAARLHVEAMSRGGDYRPLMVTLTYRAVDGWASKHVSAYIDRVRKWAARHGGEALAYVWAAELQKRGAVHYHVLLWLPKRLWMPRADKRGWWPHGMTRTEQVRNAVGYVAKYASKLRSKSGDLPKGCRLHGAGGLEPAARMERRWWLSPRWVRDAFPIEDDPRRVRGGFLSLTTGEFVASPWRVVERDGRWRWVMIEREVQGGERNV